MCWRICGCRGCRRRLRSRAIGWTSSRRAAAAVAAAGEELAGARRHRERCADAAGVVGARVTCRRRARRRSSCARWRAASGSVAGVGADDALGERADGKWAAFEVGVNVARQNGKDGILEARELTGLFLLGEQLIIHSAHQFDTSLEHFRRLLELIESTPDLDKRVKRVSRSHGEEGIELRGGQRIRFRTRTKGGGRGFTGDLVLLNEAMDLAESSIGALIPTMAATSMTGNPQVWYTGSAVDQAVHEHGVAFARIRERGMARRRSVARVFRVVCGGGRRRWEELLPDEVPLELAAPTRMRGRRRTRARHPDLGGACRERAAVDGRPDVPGGAARDRRLAGDVGRRRHRRGALGCARRSEVGGAGPGVLRVRCEA
jgi:hypothetical protein